MNLSEALIEVVGGNNGTIHTIVKTLDMIEIVGEEIGKAQKRWPARADCIYESFMMFSDDSTIFQEYDLQLWRHHVREMLDRVGNPPSKKELREIGTTAEVIVAFSKASLDAPINYDGTMAFAKLFKEVFGAAVFDKYYQKQMDGQPGYESYQGAIDELILFAKKKASRPRKFPTDEQVKGPIPVQLGMFSAAVEEVAVDTNP